MTDHHLLDPKFPCSLRITIPFPDARLANIARRSLAIDEELSALVQRDLSTAASAEAPGQGEHVLVIDYKATTNRMLRVAVNGFMESASLVLHVMQELDSDVLEKTLENGLPTSVNSDG